MPAPVKPTIFILLSMEDLKASIELLISVCSIIKNSSVIWNSLFGDCPSGAICAWQMLSSYVEEAVMSHQGLFAHRVCRYLQYICRRAAVLHQGCLPS